MTPRRKVLRLAGLGLIALALLLAVYVLVAYLAWQSGEGLRSERAQEERAAQLQEQVTRAQADLEAENYRLAQRRLEWVLETDPDYPQAQQLLDQALARQQASRVTPTPDVTRGLATATPVVTTTRTVADDEQQAERELRRLENLVEDEEWQEAIRAITSFQNDFPGYERRVTDILLYEAYIGRGVELLYTERVELGIYYLEQAEELGDLPLEVQDQLQWAELYLAGMGYYNVNWDVTVFYFRDLCLAAPFYQNACDKLHKALIAFGDQNAFAREWCPAQSLYAEAYRLQETNELAGKLAEAREGCRLATPTPSAPITNTVPFTNNRPLTNTFPITIP